jgi:hypothetical protein
MARSPSPIQSRSEKRSFPIRFLTNSKSQPVGQPNLQYAIGYQSEIASPDKATTIVARPGALEEVGVEGLDPGEVEIELEKGDASTTASSITGTQRAIHLPSSGSGRFHRAGRAFIVQR